MNPDGMVDEGLDLVGFGEIGVVVAYADAVFLL